MDWFKKLFKRSDNTAVAEQAVVRKVWTPDEVKFITKNFRKLGANEVAWQLGRTEDSVRSKAKVLGL